MSFFQIQWVSAAENVVFAAENNQPITKKNSNK
jgi:hypothetical protein